MRFAFVVLQIFGSINLFAALPDWGKVQSYQREGAIEKVVEYWKDFSTTSLPEPAWSESQFSMGLALFQLQRFDEAASFLEKVSSKSSDLYSYAQFFLGEAYHELGKGPEADKAFARSLKEKPARYHRYRARFRQGQIAYKKGHYRTASRHFFYAERRMRSSEEHPEILENLVRTEMKRNRKWRACRWMRKIYRSYPQHPNYRDWGLDLRNNTLGDDKVGCVARLGDQKARLRRLLWSGHDIKAQDEIKNLTREGPFSNYYKDFLMAEFYINQGFAEKSAALLKPYYDEQSKNADYLVLMGRVAERLGDYPAASGLYHRAFQLKRRSRSSRRLLFQSAFLNYQSQDYDGAIQGFRDVIRRYPRSSYARKARWYSAWTDYLRGNYNQAIQQFDKILRERRTRRGRWRWRQHSHEKLTYWKAMAFYQKNDFARAASLFASLSKDRLLGFYSIASHQRLGELKSKLSEPVQANLNGESESDVAIELPESVRLWQSQYAGIEDEPAEDEEELVAESEEAEGEEELEDAEGEASDEGEFLAEITDRRIQDRLSRVRSFLKLGHHFLAKWEMFEIESRTRKSDILKGLMNQYAQIGAYNRSASISELYFANERGRYGLSGVRYLWELAYPRAYDGAVSISARDHGISSEMIWSIMRAESFYKADVRSPVGAAGLMQIMPNTGRKVASLLGEGDLNVDHLVTPEVNIRLGAGYLKRLSTLFDGVLPIVAAAYNAGPHRAKNWLYLFGNRTLDEFIEHIPYSETRNYAKKVTRHFAVYSLLYGRQSDLKWLVQPISVQRPTSITLRESWSPL